VGTLEFIGDTPGQRVFIAGAGGPIGNAFCPLLWGAWHATASIVSPDRVREIESQGVNALVIDPLDAEAMRSACVSARPAIVVNLLSDQRIGLQNRQGESDQNHDILIREVGTRNLIAAAVAAGAKRIVAHSSSTFYVPESKPSREDAPLRLGASGSTDATLDSFINLERQILEAPLDSVILRLGHLYGPGTGFESPPQTGSLHTDAAAEATRRALFSGRGAYNLADDDGAVNCQHAKIELDWRSSFRAPYAKEAFRVADSIWRLRAGFGTLSLAGPIPSIEDVKRFLQKSIEEGETKILFDKLFDICWCMTWGGNELEGAEATLDALEALMPISSLGACVLMSRLFARASKLKSAYDTDSVTAGASKRTADYICDSIIVWVLKTKSPELKVQLGRLAEDTPFEDMKITYWKWAGTM